MEYTIKLTPKEIQAIRATPHEHRKYVYLGIIHNRGLYLKHLYKFTPKPESIYLPECFRINTE
jgi:hypothetical protein